MNKENQHDFFIIERLDQDEESDCLSTIYDLSILDRIKEIKDKKSNSIKKYYNNILKNEKIKTISQNKKEQIIKVIKKAILSINLTYKWKLISFKQTLIFIHLFIFISGISSFIRDNASSFLLNKTTNHTSDNFTISYNYNYNNNSNFTNEFEFDKNSSFLNNSSMDSQNYFQNLNKKKYIIISILINQIIMAPIWYLLFFKYTPKSEKIDKILHKITSHLLICDSYENENYFYCLMKDYSILVTKKNYYLKNINSPNNNNFSMINFSKKNYIPEKNIFLYCINIINDIILDDFAKVHYFRLISDEDYNDINILIKYIESNMEQNIKKFNKKILMPIVISIIISIFYNTYTSNIYSVLFTILLLTILLIGEYIFKEYYRTYKNNIDKFINNYNHILLPKKRFVYRKNKIIMYLALKDNNYTKIQIIKTIEKIINS